MSHNDFVSVTIVTYNSGRFIKRCLESVLEQRYPTKEVIVIDNASTDGTIDILEQFEARRLEAAFASSGSGRARSPSGEGVSSGCSCATTSRTTTRWPTWRRGC